MKTLKAVALVCLIGVIGIWSPVMARSAGLWSGQAGFTVGHYTDDFKDAGDASGNSLSFSYRFSLPFSTDLLASVGAEGYATYATPDSDNADGTAYDLGLLGVYTQSFPIFPVFSSLDVSPKLGMVYSTRYYDVTTASGGLTPGTTLDGGGIAPAYGIDFSYMLTDAHGLYLDYLVSRNPDIETSGTRIEGDTTRDFAIGYVMRF
jgi:hypothetical protein